MLVILEAPTASPFRTSARRDPALEPWRQGESRKFLGCSEEVPQYEEPPELVEPNMSQPTDHGLEVEKAWAY